MKSQQHRSNRSEPARPVRIGVGGWTYAPWRGLFYPQGLPQKCALEYMSRQLASVEINATYYGSQKPESFAKWFAETPDNFLFAVKRAAFCNQPPHARRSGRFDRTILCQRRDGTERQTRPDQLAIRAD